MRFTLHSSRLDDDMAGNGRTYKSSAQKARKLMLTLIKNFQNKYCFPFIMSCGCLERHTHQQQKLFAIEVSFISFPNFFRLSIDYVVEHIIMVKSWEYRHYNKAINGKEHDRRFDFSSCEIFDAIVKENF